MAAVVVVDAFKEMVRIRITAGTDDVVDAGTIIIPAIPGKGVLRNRCHRPQVRQCRPEAISHRQMRGMQCPRLAAIEALGKIVCVPKVEVPALRAVDADDPEEMSLGDSEAASVPRRHDQLISFGPANARGLVFNGEAPAAEAA